MNKNNEFKASTVELAIKNGLEELGITQEEADIEILSNGGIFSKALVRITPKDQKETDEAEDNDVTSDEAVTESEENIESETEETNEEESEESNKEETTETEEPVVRSKKKERTPEEMKERFEAMKALEEVGKEFLNGYAELISASVNISCKVKEDEICFYIGGEDAKSFIGYRGEALDAIQTLLSQYLNKDVENREDKYRVIVDADFYRERKKKSLVLLAKKLAKQAYDRHREISLEPMNSYERRIIHSTLQNSYEATTRSEGEGRNRHVVIVPKNGTMTYGNTSSEFRKKGPSKTKSYGYNKRKF